MNVAVATRMTVDEIGVALAVFCKLFEADPRVARGQLDPTPRAHFDEACVWADSNAKVIRLLADDPQSVAAGSYSLNEARGWLSRLFTFGQKRGVNAPADDELEQVAAELRDKKRDIDEEKQRKLAALRELVDESMDAR